LQLREKQKIKRIYGLDESQFRSWFEKADRMKGITGSNLLVMLEKRLDNVAYRVGFSNSRAEARQLVKHGHFLVNGKKVNIPNYQVAKGDVVEVVEKSKNTNKILAAIDGVKRREIPQWLELDTQQLKARIRDIPTRDDITAPMEERLVVELYSK
jgi:small subunit ribosomal protein S4